MNIIFRFVPIEVFVLFLSYVASLALEFFQIPRTVMMQILSVSIVILLISYNWLYRVTTDTKVYSLLRYFVIFYTAFFVEVLVFSTGGFFSPLLILLNLFILGSSFLLDIKSSLFFLFFTAIALITHIYLKPAFYSSQGLDPWVAVIYLISFIIVAPIAVYISKAYRLQDKVSLYFKERSLMGSKRESEILTGLSDMVILTNYKLEILTVNTAAETYLGLATNLVLGQNFLKVIRLRNERLIEATFEDLFLDKIVNTREPLSFNDFYLVSKDSVDIHKVTIQIRPIEDLGGKIIQFVFLITNFKKEELVKASLLEPLRQKQQRAMKELEEYFEVNNLKKLAGEVELLEHREEDLFLTAEIDKSSIRPTTSLCYVIPICRQQIIYKRLFAQSLGVDLGFSMRTQAVGSETQLLEFGSLRIETNPEEYSYSVLSDQKWLPVLIGKLIEIGILLSSKGSKPVVRVSAEKIGEDSIQVLVNCNNCPVFIQTKQDQLFEQHYPGLNKDTNLGLGSGLEGYLAKKIALDMNLQIRTTFLPPSSIQFAILIRKNPFKSAKA